MNDLDEKDRLLLGALRADARMSLIELTRHVGLSRSAVHERIRRLEANGVIAGYTVKLGTERERPGVEALVAIGFQPGRNCDHIVPHLSGIPNVVTCWSLAGPTDLMLLIECASNAELDTIRRQIATTPGIATVQTHVSLRTHFDRR
ncbi:Lrp/AsnC family transcriptional regulator [Shinella sp. CPCC 100929]|uniref:Lrp/AsnC family transcriptional regulator n=1 Tax=Shinella lacus TaxID=2654216 RepID=A0ABT1REJ1_9HYPH|nr:Lrp/AsnC family transcriptional regulator [Shinella lacus]MCQ4633567.1 Lrp/AsnC family transcriptional regulator [Shinella lacus]